MRIIVDICRFVSLKILIFTNIRKFLDVHLQQETYRFADSYGYPQKKKASKYLQFCLCKVFTFFGDITTYMFAPKKLRFRPCLASSRPPLYGILQSITNPKKLFTLCQTHRFSIATLQSRSSDKKRRRTLGDATRRVENTFRRANDQTEKLKEIFNI